MGLVGGMIDQGETPEQALTREISEEINLKVKENDLQKIGLFNLKFHNVIADAHIYEINIKDKFAPKLSEHIDYRWVSVEEAGNMNHLTKGLKDLLTKHI